MNWSRPHLNHQTNVNTNDNKAQIFNYAQHTLSSSYQNELHGKRQKSYLRHNPQGSQKQLQTSYFSQICDTTLSSETGGAEVTQLALGQSNHHLANLHTEINNNMPDVVNENINNNNTTPVRIRGSPHDLHAEKRIQTTEMNAKPGKTDPGGSGSVLPR